MIKELKCAIHELSPCSCFLWELEKLRDEISCLKELILKKDAMLEDIKIHTVKPFEGEKWMNYLKYIAEEAIKLTEEVE